MVRPEQRRFVADHTPIAALVLAKAYVRPAELLWEPCAFMMDELMIGLCALACEPRSLENYWIFHFFIDQRFQGQGYGGAALRLLLQSVRERYPHCQVISLTVHPENRVARRLYATAGFRPTGERLDGEPIYQYVFSL